MLIHAEIIYIEPVWRFLHYMVHHGRGITLRLVEQGVRELGVNRRIHDMWQVILLTVYDCCHYMQQLWQFN